MIRYGALLGLAAAFVGTGHANAQALMATTPGIVDPLEARPAPGAIPAALGGAPTLVQRAAAPAKPLPPTGNPLWAVPVKTLSVTQERPIFTPSRRPPAPPVLAAAVTRPAPPPPKPTEPAHPPLWLVGAVSGEHE